jgi:hypothetical protein
MICVVLPATPVTELYFKSVMQKGQTSMLFFTLNINPRLHFSIAYKGLRSEGRYINQLASTGTLDSRQVIIKINAIFYEWSFYH